VILSAVSKAAESWLTVEKELWTVSLTTAAQADFRAIIDWTVDQLGDKQALVYENTIAAAPEALSDGPTTIGIRERADIGKGLFTLHVARGNRRGRQFVLFRVADRGRTRTIEVLRLLHDAMDFDRHIPGAQDR
jgi:toxin ParE1/3/4